ncbi:MAG: alpha/beta hydrolase [Ilumatobacter sp.]|uniref:alpha/beta hydrolase n=1 Tax=Ilumatobacter sp. TaxID=1967498 RepID=UPI003C78DF6A
MTPSVRARIFRRMMGLFVAPADATLERRRADMERAGKIPRPRSFEYSRVVVGGVPANRATPSESDTRRHLLYFHGGAYILGSADSHTGIAARLAAKADATATVLDYRLAPEHPYPAGRDDCVAATRALIAEVGAEHVAIAGDSAGGGATIATLCALRDAGDPLPACAFVLSPWVDLTMSGATIESKRDIDPVIADEFLASGSVDYLGDTAPDDPGASPLFADLAGLPPILVQVGSDEMLLADSQRLVDAVEQAGGAVELDVWPGMWHVFQGFVGLMPEANRAMQHGADFIKRHTSG